MLIFKVKFPSPIYMIQPSFFYTRTANGRLTGEFAGFADNAVWYGTDNNGSDVVHLAGKGTAGYGHSFVQNLNHVGTWKWNTHTIFCENHQYMYHKCTCLFSDLQHTYRWYTYWVRIPTAPEFLTLHLCVCPSVCEQSISKRILSINFIFGVSLLSDPGTNWLHFENKRSKDLGALLDSCSWNDIGNFRQTCIKNSLLQT